MALLNEGIEVNMQDKNGWTALHCAAYSKNKNVFQVLIDQPTINVSIKNESGSTPLVSEFFFNVNLSQFLQYWKHFFSLKNQFFLRKFFLM